jgi:hypothetical protein
MTSVELRRDRERRRRSERAGGRRYCDGFGPKAKAPRQAGD